MPSPEFIEVVKKVRKQGKPEKMTVKKLLWIFGNYSKRTSGNVWRIKEYLDKEKMTTEPDYQTGWIGQIIELKEKEKVKIHKGVKVVNGEFDPITRLSILEAASKVPISVTRDADLEKAYHLMWANDYSQLPVMNGERDILGMISWKSIAKGLITKKESRCVRDFMTNDYKTLDENTPLFEAIKEVIHTGIVFVVSKDKKILGPVTPFDLNEEFIEQIEPFILLEQIENYIRLILHDKIDPDDIHKILTVVENGRKIDSISDMNFGEYLRILANKEMWELLNLPFNKADFVNELDDIRKIRNGVMHFHPDKISDNELKALRRMSTFLMDYNKNC